MVKPRPDRLRYLAFFGLLTLALFASGCVYLRLLELKNQLASFDQHFAVTSTSGVQLTFKDPVLYGDDVRWLGADPETIQKTNTSEHWVVRWSKEPAPGVKETGVYDVALEADFANRKLRSVLIPERYFTAVPKDLFLNALRSAGHAKIDRQSRQAVMEPGGMEGPSAPPDVTVNSIEQMIGLPTQHSQTADAVVYRYIFRPQTPNGPGRPVDMTFEFSSSTKVLRKLTAKLPRGTLRFNFAPSSPDAGTK